jgi:hypothetical protein
MRLKKFFAKLFVILSTFFVVLSPIVLVEEAHHNCVHEDCQICEVIRTAKETIKQTKIASPVSGVIFLLPLLFAFIFSIAFISFDIGFSTLVSLKTKLSN